MQIAVGNLVLDLLIAAVRLARQGGTVYPYLHTTSHPVRCTGWLVIQTSKTK
jgi:hypothetical protein